MNVTCPSCATVYRVDPTKVPEGGVRARCSTCQAIFRVAREVVATSAEPSPAPAAPVSPPMEPPVSAPAPPAAVEPAPPPVAAVPVEPEAPPLVSTAAATPVPVSPETTPSPPEQSPPPGVSGVARPINPFLSRDPALKARRLARALISDMVVYHPAKRQEGLRDGTLKHLFEEEIRKSWEEYAEQVGPDLAESTPYFREALNEILAGGTPVF